LTALIILCQARLRHESVEVAKPASHTVFG
jgi:hypothetical protein